MNRRDFLQFLGISGITLVLTEDALASALKKPKNSNYQGLKPLTDDQLVTAQGIDHEILISWGDQINLDSKFGYNNDFIAFHPLTKSSAILWVNHEYVHPLFIKGIERNKTNIDAERLEVGGSLLEIKRDGNKWKVVKNSPYNRRIDGTTKIPFAWKIPIAGETMAIGTLANCAGGQTPWGTILTCEENYDACYGERLRDGTIIKSSQNWEKFYPLPPEHYGWVVEVNPITGESKKLISLGRCAHESATITKTKDGKIVAYSGDDSVNEHLYKFISNSKDSLEEGRLYVANLEQGRWIPLSLDEQPILKEKFSTQTEVLIYMREAAKLVGATPLDRPEDIEIDPLTGNILVALTNNKGKKNYYGSILKIMEEGNDPGSLNFSHETFLTGGKETGFACPDNLVFDPAGNLWFTSDISGSDIGKGPYQGLGNNALFVFLRTGNQAGQIIRLVSAPVDAELTGPCFSPDYKTLFLSVQHPGETTKELNKPTSQWPGGKLPRPSVITLEGDILDKIVQGKL